jgi:Zn-dependent M28 family amino/carboxypeptidase
MKKSIVLAVLLLTSGVTAQVAPRSTIINAEQLLLDLKVLSADDMEGRKPDTAGSAKARDYIVKRFKESGIKPFGESYFKPFDFSFSKETAVHHGVNVIGYLEGTARKGHYLVVTAHYDHLGIKDGQIYNGADNASGSAGLFAVASYFKEHPPANSILFCAFDAEEDSPAGGASNFINHPPVKLESMVMNVNLDMICRDKNDLLYAVGTYHYPFLKPYLEKVASQSKIKLRLGHDNPTQKEIEDWTTESDHFHFHAKKIPFIYFGVEDNEQHHRPTDDYENITPGFYVHAVETILAAIEEFDRHAVEIQQKAKR